MEAVPADAGEQREHQRELQCTFGVPAELSQPGGREAVEIGPVVPKLLAITDPTAHCTDAGVQVVFVVSPTLRRLLGLVGLPEVLPLLGSRDEASLASPSDATSWLGLSP
jgi:hypothetical protein